VNSEYCKQALAKVGNPNVLINLVSRRVRQLNSGGGGLNRPLIIDCHNMGAGDIALVELIEDKMAFEAPLLAKSHEPAPIRRKKK
jgi:DNA-directed RNA polymerase subunit omega